MRARCRTSRALLALAVLVLLAGCRDEEPERPSGPPNAEWPAPSTGQADPAPDRVPPDPAPTPVPPPPPAPNVASDFEPPAPPQPVPSDPVAPPPDEPPPPLVLPPLSTRPDTRPDDDIPPLALDELPPAAVGQFAVYAITTAGEGTLLRQTVASVGPGPNDLTVVEQLMRDGRPIGPERTRIVPRGGRRWPRRTDSEARRVAYERETIELAGVPLDCIVLTIESRSTGPVQVERRWISAQAPVTHLARLVVTSGGRELLRQELVDFGPRD